MEKASVHGSPSGEALRKVATSGEFRSDINGLRAWAVLAVVLYHFRVPPFHGGFVGVDVFFVISGFLMTQIIVRGLEADKFSVISFYISRARRIVPALAVLCFTLLVFGWKFLLAADYRLLSGHVVSSLGFVSNIKYLKEAGYFNPSSHEKWLLHTWSLSVEWQFYLLLPIVLVLAWKLVPTRKMLAALLAVFFLLSLVLSVALSGVQPEASFYLLHTRAWELVLGGLVFMLVASVHLSAGQRFGVELIGMVLICASIIFITPATTWPGIWAAVPVLGTALVLLAYRNESSWTGARFFQWIGSRSYSIYLWHWPVCVALITVGLDQSVAWLCLGILLSLLLGHLSYGIAEVPVRKWMTRISPVPAVVVLVGAVVLLVAPSLYIRQNEGLVWRLPRELQVISAGSSDKNPRFDECHVAGPTKVPQCRYGGAKLGAIVLGDSHGASYVRSLEKALPDGALHVLDWTMSGCPAIAGIKSKKGVSDSNCGEFVEWAIGESERLGGNAPLFIITRSSSYVFGPNEFGREAEVFPAFYFSEPTKGATDQFLTEYQDALVSTACRLAETRPVYFVRPTPEFRRDVPRGLWREYWFGPAARLSVSAVEYRMRNEFVLAAQNLASARCGVSVIDPIPYLCDQGQCMGAKDGRPLYYDDDHLSEYGAQQLIPLLKSALEKELSGQQ